jgi:hypothetical protein
VKQTVWLCDRCLKSVKSYNFPKGWVTALVADEEFYPGGDIPVHVIPKHWCGECWRVIDTPLPQEMKIPR